MFSGISIWQLLILLAIVVLLFGTKKLRNMGGHLGGAIKGFRSSMKEVKVADESADQQAEASTAEADEAGPSEEVKTEKV